MLLTVIPYLSACATLTMTEVGFKQIYVSRFDSILFPLFNRTVVFLDLIPDSFTLSYRPRAGAEPMIFEQKVSSFIVAGKSLRMRPLVHRAPLCFWILSKSHCPDPSAIVLASTDRRVLFTASVGSVLCVFVPTFPTFFRAEATINSGWPSAAFYSSRGRGELFRSCLGETARCAIESSHTFFTTFRGPASVTFSCNVAGPRQNGLDCGVEAIFQLQSAGFVRRNDVVDKALVSCVRATLKKQGSFRTVAPIMAIVFAAVLFAVGASFSAGTGRETRFGGWFAANMRRSYESC
jgi:hypothetical protein